MLLTDVEFKKANISHIKQILEIEELCFATPWSEASYKSELSDDHAFYLVALLGDDVIGYCGYWEIVGEGHITNVAVHPDYQGQGLGSQLLRRLIEYAVQAGIDSFTLEVREDNVPAIKLYEKYGFTAVGLRKNYYPKEKKNAIIMWKHV